MKTQFLGTDNMLEFELLMRQKVQQQFDKIKEMQALYNKKLKTSGLKQEISKIEKTLQTEQMDFFDLK